MEWMKASGTMRPGTRSAAAVRCRIVTLDVFGADSTATLLADAQEATAEWLRTFTSTRPAGQNQCQCLLL